MKNLFKIFLVWIFALSLMGCNTTEDAKKNDQKNSDIIEMNSEFFDSDVEGKLQYKITGAKVYHALSEAGIASSDCTEPESDYFEDDSDHLKEGCCLLILDVTAQNINAENDFKNWDKSIFRADSINLVTKEDGTVSPVSDLCYFSLHDQCEEHPFSYKLPKGESCTFQVGHIVAEDDLPIIYASDHSAYSKDAVYISLDLGKAD